MSRELPTMPAVSAPNAPAAALHFGRFALQPAQRQLHCDGQPVALGARALDLLLALLAKPGELVTKEALLQAAWPGLVVEEANVHVQVSALRKLLGAQAIATVPGLGYRFTLPLQAERAAPAHKLPVEATSFIGREAALAEAAAALSHTRLLTLVGIGGTGKTRLALRLARQALPQFADGVWFVDLAPLDDPEQLPLAVARTLGLVQRPGHSLQDELAEHLHSRQALLLLDNGEHLLDAVAALAQHLLQAAPRLTLLCTSREALGLAEERSLPVRPLALPSAGADDETLAQSEAVRLFMDRAAAIAPAALGPDSMALAAEICRRLDGIPLALELAAARLKLLSLRQLQGLLDERLRLLSGSARTLARQQTLQAVIQWSYEHLGADAQALLRALAVCGGGCGLGTAAALLGGAPAADVLQRLGQLLDKGLVAVVHEAEEARYTMLETVRQFALERLAEAGEAATTRDRHRDHFITLAEEAERQIAGRNPAEWIARLDRDRDNLLRALAWCDAPGGALAGLRLVTLLGHFWSSRGLMGLGLQQLQHALQRPGAEADHALRGTALNLLAQYVFWTGDPASARAQGEAALALGQRLGDLHTQAGAHRQLAQICNALNDDAAALAHAEAALQLARETGNVSDLAKALGVRAGQHGAAGETAAAKALYVEARALRRQAGHAFDEAIAVLNLAFMALDEGDTVQARQLLREAQALHLRTGSRYLGQHLVDVAAALAAKRGDWPHALRWQAASVVQRQAVQLPRAVLSDLQAATRQQGRLALGDVAADHAEAAGAALDFDSTLAELTAWLATEAKT